MSLPLFRPGDRVGALTIVSRQGTTPERCVLWLVKCDCGTSVVVPSHRLTGRLRSCGCLPLAPGRSTHNPRVGYPSQKELWVALDYDPNTGGFRWKAPASPNIPIGSVAGSRANGYIHIRLRGFTYKAHHLAWIYVHGEMHSMPYTDHRDGNKSNNAIANLRPCSNAENQANQRGGRRAGLPKGVRQNRNGTLFHARIRHQSFLYDLGAFKTATEAARAYFSVAQKLYGEFARQDWNAEP
jgi:HNH endonuclease